MSTKTIMAKFTAIAASPVTCSASYGSYMYFGGADGILYRTVDGSYHDEFWRIGAGPITSVGVYADAIFVGTSPGGEVYMHNFSTGNRFHYVSSGDDAVTAMCVNDDVLYVGTSRSGIILSFDGERWTKEYEAMRSISAMCSYGGSLYVFFLDSDSVLVNDGAWRFMSDGKSIFSVGGKFKVSTSLKSLESGRTSESGISGAVVSGSKIYFSGKDRAVLYSFDGSSVVIENQFGEGIIGCLSGGGNGQVFVSVGDSVYVNIVEEGGENGDS